MNIAIVTGATSFIGRNLVKELMKRNYYVIQCYRHTPLKIESQDKAWGSLGDNATFLIGEINRALEKVPHYDKIEFYHIASLGSSTDDFKRIGDLNYHNELIVMDMNAIFIAEELGAEFIYASSIGALNPRHGQPGEGYDLAKRATSFYLETKEAGRVVYLPSVIGPDMDIDKSRLIPNIVKGTFKRDLNLDINKMYQLCYIDEAVKMLINGEGKRIINTLDIIIKEAEYWSLDGKTPVVHDELEDAMSKTVLGIKRRLK